MSLRCLVPLSGRYSPALRLLCAAALLVVAPVVVQAQIPSDVLRKSLKPSADVNDFAGILSPSDNAALESRCAELRQKTGAQLAVVILKSLQGGQVDDFTNKLFSEWGVGEKGKNNGLMLLVALDDRKARIEVGYGLEPVLPDALAGRILQEQLFPAFKQQRYGDGMRAAVDRIVEIVVRGEPAPAQIVPNRRNDIPTLLFLGLFVGIGSFFVGAGLGARVGILILWGGFFGGVALFIGIAAAPIAPIVHGCFAVAFGLLGWRTGRRKPEWFRSDNRTTGGYADDMWVWGSSGGGSSSDWSSGGFSSSSGSFGGGSSGGGGASGSW